MVTWRTWWGAAPWSPPPCRWWGTPRAAARGTTARSRCGATASPWAAPASSGYCMVYYLSIISWCHVMMIMLLWCHVKMSCDAPDLHVMLITLPVSTCMSGPPSTTTSASEAMYVSLVTYHNRYIRELSETFAQQIIVIASNAQNPSSARVCLIQYKLLRLRAVSS